MCQRTINSRYTQRDGNRSVLRVIKAARFLLSFPIPASAWLYGLTLRLIAPVTIRELCQVQRFNASFRMLTQFRIPRRPWFSFSAPHIVLTQVMTFMWTRAYMCNKCSQSHFAPLFCFLSFSFNLQRFSLVLSTLLGLINRINLHTLTGSQSKQQ